VRETIATEEEKERRSPARFARAHIHPVTAAGRAAIGRTRLRPTTVQRTTRSLQSITVRRVVRTRAFFGKGDASLLQQSLQCEERAQAAI